MAHEGACPTVYGPVRSRRHGLSLGINLGSPARKVCTWGCIYCQCGFGQRDESLRDDEIPQKERVIEDLRVALRANLGLDSVTFAGNSEPAAHPDFPWLVREAKKLQLAMRARWVLNMLSNGSELHRDEILAACNLLDEAWIKLDCAIDDLFRRLNRPIFRVGDVRDHVARVARLKKPRIQTLVWKSTSRSSVSNWTEENRRALLDAYREIRPVEIHLTTISRTPALVGLEAVREDELLAFAAEIRALGFTVEAYPGKRA